MASTGVSKLLERSRTQMHYIRETILWVQENWWKFCRVQTKGVTHWWTIISEVTSLIKTQFILALMQGRGLLCCVHCDTCGLYPSQKIVQLGRNQDWFVIWAKSKTSVFCDGRNLADIFSCPEFPVVRLDTMSGFSEWTANVLS